MTLPPDAIRELFRAATGLNLQPRYNVAPTQEAPVIGIDETGQRAVKMFRWGLVPRWSKEMPKSAPLINARSEGIAEKPTFRDAFARRRCLVVADGFYEWPQDKSAKVKLPWRIVPTDRPGIAFAGVWEAWRKPDGEILRSFAIVTTTANERIAPIHERMPVMLPASAEDAWLAPETPPEQLRAMLTPYPAALTDRYRVDPRVNSVKNDDPDCIKPLV